ncbi:hypothetical protein [Flavobacterium sp.]|uniref:hypothetical protein n=1 Tax=Flavobacterium sp. TaxID=239 RepID=UPI00261CD461|nr:hypothetical protein [Flavobacterium sp.]MDG2433123.1 hypothetical protein [Flavobacterium sp.]
MINYKLSKNKATFLLLFLCNLIVALLAFYVLPKKFFYDAMLIAYDKGNEIGFLGSYPLTILFYKITYLRYLSFPIVALIQYPILIYVLYKVGIPKNFNLLTIKNLLVYLGFFMIAVFMSMPSKEFITYLYLALIVFIYKSDRFSFKKSVVYSMLLLLLFGAFYRPYFLLIPIISIGMYGLRYVQFKNKTMMTLFYGLCIAFFLSLSYGLVKGQYLSESSREVVNLDRLNSQDANSIIVSPIKPDSWYGEAIGIAYGFFTVNVPVNGLKHVLSPQILAFVIWQLLLFSLLLVRFSNCLKSRRKENYELWLLLILFSYFIVQGVFEPDLGTAIRHKIGVFPLIYFALYYDNFREKLR